MIKTVTDLVDIVIESDLWQDADLDAWAQAATQATLAHLGLDPTAHEVVLLACDDARIAALNGDFRDKSNATNVLSWPSAERAAEAPGGHPLPPDQAELGDIALAYETCAREAAEGGLTMADHCTHLIVHAVLHLLGYDHEDDQDATVMENTETQILAQMGIADPYKGTCG